MKFVLWSPHQSRHLSLSLAVGRSFNFLFFIFSLISLISLQTYAQPLSENETQPHDRTLELSRTDDELKKNLVGQHLMISVSGKSLSRRDREVIQNVRPGSVVLFKFNIESVSQLQKLISDIQIESVRASGHKVIIAIDQEGGDVIRIKTNDPMPSARALGVINDLKLTYEAGVRTGRLLSSFGIGINLAPVLDVLPHFRQPFLMTRSYSSSPRLVTEHALAYAKGLSLGRVIPTFKHFPGHGATTLDSHLVLPTAQGDLFSVLAQQIYPFRKTIQSFPQDSAVMMAHIKFPQLDSSRLPATFSKPIIQYLLRDSLHFRGPIITDDLEMKALAPFGSLADRTFLALNAGSTLVMVLWSAENQLEVARQLYLRTKTDPGFVSLLNKNVSLYDHTLKHFETSEKVETPKLLRKLASDQLAHSRLQDMTTDRILSSHKAHLKQFDWKNLALIISRDKKEFLSFKRTHPFGDKLKWFKLTSKSSPQDIESFGSQSTAVLISTGSSSARIFSSLEKKYKNRILALDYKGFLAGSDSLQVITFFYSPINIGASLFNREGQENSLP